MKAGSTLILNQARDLFSADMIIYQYLIGKLIYLDYRTRPDIAFVIGQLSHLNSDPLVEYLRIIKQVLRYLKKTNTIGIIQGKDLAGYQKRYKSHKVISYANSSYTEEIDDQKSITGYSFFFRRANNTWCNKQQGTISTLLSEAKYVAMSYCIRKGIWIQKFLNELLLE